MFNFETYVETVLKRKKMKNAFYSLFFRQGAFGLDIKYSILESWR